MHAHSTPTRGAMIHIVVHEAKNGRIRPGGQGNGLGVTGYISALDYDPVMAFKANCEGKSLLLSFLQVMLLVFFLF